MIGTQVTPQSLITGTGTGGDLPPRSKQRTCSTLMALGATGADRFGIARTVKPPGVTSELAA